MQVCLISNDENYKFGWLQGRWELLRGWNFWLRGVRFDVKSAAPICCGLPPSRSIS